MIDPFHINFDDRQFNTKRQVCCGIQNVFIFSASIASTTILPPSKHELDIMETTGGTWAGAAELRAFQAFLEAQAMTTGIQSPAQDGLVPKVKLSMRIWVTW